MSFKSVLARLFLVRSNEEVYARESVSPREKNTIFASFSKILFIIQVFSRHGGARHRESVDFWLFWSGSTRAVGQHGHFPSRDSLIRYIFWSSDFVGLVFHASYNFMSVSFDVLGFALCWFCPRISSYFAETSGCIAFPRDGVRFRFGAWR